jgi:hypothetical protein
VTATIAPASRGGLLLRVVVAGLAFFALAAVVFALAVRVPTRSPGPGWVRGAAVSVVRHRGVVQVPLAHAFLVSDGTSRPIALYDRSPQMGERIRYCRASGWFEDPAHGSKFDGLGRYAVGPAPRGMDRFEVDLVDGVAWIDTSAILAGPARGAPTTPPAGPFCVRAG